MASDAEKQEDDDEEEVGDAHANIPLLCCRRSSDILLL